MDADTVDMEREYEALLHFLYLAPVGLAQTSIDGEIAMLNPLSSQLLMPLSPDACLTNLFTVLENVAPDLRTRAANFSKPQGLICDGMRIQLQPATMLNPDPQSLSLTLLKLDQHRLMAVLNDVTHQLKRDRLLRQSEAWLDAIFTGVSDYALLSLDHEGRVAGWNASIGRVTGFDRDAVLGQPYSIFYPSDGTTPDRVLDRLREADDSGWSLDDGWRRRADGSRFWGSAMITPLRVRELGADGAPVAAAAHPAYCLIIRDITDKHEASEQIRRANACDHLTGIANRRTFFDAAELEVTRWARSPRPLSLILFDADHFKRINDRHGHPAGDAVLRHLAASLTATFRACDVVARVGGEEFAVLLPSTAAEGATAVAERLLQAIAGQPVRVDGADITYTVSGGVASMGAGIGDLETLMKRADQALYAAKQAGRNRIHHAG